MLTEIIKSNFRRLYPISAPFVARVWPTARYLSKDILQPAESNAVVPPYISDASLDLITAAHPWSSLIEEITTIKSRKANHAAVVRYFHGSGIVGPDGFATTRVRESISSGFAINALRQNLSEVKYVNYINNRAIARYFGHWITDGLPQTYFSDRENFYLTESMAWHHCKEYRGALGLRPADQNYLSVESIVTHSDFSQGSSKRQRYAEIKRRLQNILPKKQNEEKVFLWRGDTGVARRFRDADKLKERLQGDGWHIIDVTAPLSDLLSALAGARIVAGMEGSHINHSHLCTRSGTAIVILVPHDHFTAVQLGLVRAVGNYCGFCVLPGNMKEGYFMDFDTFTETVDHTFRQADYSA